MINHDFLAFYMPKHSLIKKTILFSTVKILRLLLIICLLKIGRPFSGMEDNIK